MKIGWRTISVIGRVGAADADIVPAGAGMQADEQRGGEQAEQRHAEVRTQIE